MAVVRVRTKELVLLVGFVLAALWCANAPRNSNAVTRLGLAHSLAVHGVVNIDEVAPYTVDKAHHGSHYYCDKAPGLSLLCVPAVWLSEKVADIAGLPEPYLPVSDPHRASRYALSAIACLLSTSILFGAWAIIAFRRSVRRGGAKKRTADFFSLVLAFGTPLFIWSTAVFGHATSTALLFIGFAFHWQRGSAGELTPRRYAVAGLVLSLATLVELTALPAAAVIGLLLLIGGTFPEQRRPLVSPTVAMIAGALGPGLALLVYNAAAFGSPFHLGYASVVGFDGMKSGFFGINLPTLTALWGITLGAARGIVWLSPILLFCVPALAVLLRRRSPDRSAFIACLLIVIYYLLLNSGYYYWDGGYSLGPRHITPLVPFALFPVAVWMDQMSPAIRASAIVASILSILVTVAATVVTFSVEDDGLSIILGHLVPRFLRQESDLLLANLPIPYAVVVTVPYLMVGAVAAFLLRRRPKDLRTAEVLVY